MMRRRFASLHDVSHARHGGRRYDSWHGNTACFSFKAIDCLSHPRARTVMPCLFSPVSGIPPHVKRLTHARTRLQSPYLPP